MELINATISYFTKNWFTALVIVVLVAWIIGVRFYNYWRLEPGFARIATSLESVEELKAGTTADYLLKAHPFAAMSAIVYNKAGEDGRRSSIAGSEDTDLAGSLNGWRELVLGDMIPDKPSPDSGAQAGLDGELVYGIWVKEHSEDHAEVALVFRGTQTWGDWWSNARWITRFLSTGWDQYDLTTTVARYVEKDLVAQIPELKSKKTIEFVAAGHSLGGGLAQQAGYAARKIKRVYSFNGSSVTGFYSLDKAARDASKSGMHIFRIGERGEVLAYLRALMRIFFPVLEKDPKIVEVTYNFGDGNLISQHSMAELAKELQALAK